MILADTLALTAAFLLRRALKEMKWPAFPHGNRTDSTMAAYQGVPSYREQLELQFLLLITE